MATTTTRPGPSAPAGEAEPDASGKNAATKGVTKKKSSRKKLMILVPLLLVLGVAAKMVFLGGGAKQAAVPKPGPVVSLDAVTVNLQGGHYLRIGVAVEFTDQVNAATPPDGARATDQTIAYFTGGDAAPLETATGLAVAKKGLKDKIVAVYPDDPVYDILITSFVVQ